jgi:MarR family transcriptional regulator, negative regulator of the multidrug operon emrRAB
MDNADADRTTNLFGALTLVAADAIRQATEQAAAHTAAAPAALVALYEFLDGRSVDDLCHVVGLTPSGAVRLIDRLAANGYLERHTGADRRSVSVVLTTAGRRAARKILAARAEAIESILGTLDESERASLTDILDKLVRSTTANRLAERKRGQAPVGGWTCRLCDFSACGRDRGLCPAADQAGTGSPGHQP